MAGLDDSSLGSELYGELVSVCEQDGVLTSDTYSALSEVVGSIVERIGERSKDKNIASLAGSDLYGELVGVCQRYGALTRGTYAALDDVVGSIAEPGYEESADEEAEVETLDAGQETDDDEAYDE
jgi:hypothetical protein